MRNHAATVRQVVEDSFLVLVNDLPIHHTTKPSIAEAMVRRLQRFFEETRPDDELVVSVGEGHETDRCRVLLARTFEQRGRRETVVLELASDPLRYAWVQASTIADNLREALQPAWRDQTYDLQFKNSKVYFDTQKVIPSKEKLNPSAEEHLPRIDRVLQRIPTDYGTVIFYSKRNDQENMYAGFISKTDDVYDLVPVSNYLAWELSSAEMVKLLNQPLPFLRIQGAYGSNTIRTYYYRLDKDAPQLLLEVDGTIYEVDIDNDQDKEIISVWGIPSITKIHTWEENRFREANVTLSLKAESVVPVERDNQILFDAYREPPQPADGKRPEATTAPTPTTYKYENGKMVPVS